MTSSEARTLTLERKLEQALAQIAALMGRLAADEQLLAQLASQQGGYGVGGPPGVLPAYLTASLAAGSIGSPSTAAGTLLVDASGGFTTSGGTAITIHWEYTTPITVSSSKFGWVTQRPDGNYHGVTFDC
jgi:hypothetical protein